MSQASTSTAAKPGRKKAHKNNVPRSLIDLVPGDGSSTANTRETDELARSSTNNKRKRRHDEFQEMLNNDNDDEDDVYIHSSPLPAGQKTMSRVAGKKRERITVNNPNPAFKAPVSKIVKPTSAIQTSIDRVVTKSISNNKATPRRTPPPAAPRHDSPVEPERSDDEESDDAEEVVSSGKGFSQGRVPVFLKKTEDRDLKSAAAKKVYIEYTKTEAEAKADCELWNRRVYIAGLDRTKSAVPVGKVFPGLSSTNAIFKSFSAKSVNDFKNWKTQVLKKITVFSDTWFQKHRGDLSITNSTDFKFLSSEINKEFQAHWLPVIFSVFTTAIDFDEISPLGFNFLRYAAVMLLTFERLNVLYNNSKNPELLKYERSRLISVYDGLHKKKEFASLSVEDFPFLEVPVPAKRVSRPVVDPNDDEDLDVDEDFFS